MLFFFFLFVAANVIEAKDKFIFEYCYPSKFFMDLKADKNFESIKCLDARYIGVTEESLKIFLQEYKEAVKFKKFKLENSDCDDFALFFKFLSSFFHTRAKDTSYALCVGFAIVESKEEALGISPSEAHAINLIWSNVGWIVVEPQNGEYCQLKDYPNKIKWIMF